MSRENLDLFCNIGKFSINFETNLKHAKNELHTEMTENHDNFIQNFVVANLVF